MDFAKFFLPALALQFLLTASAYSAESLSTVQLVFDQHAAEQRHSLLVIGNDRVATVDANNDVLSIFDAGSGKLYTLDHDHLSYRVSDVASVHRLAEQIAAGMAALESRIAELPAAQQNTAREQLLALFPQREPVAGESTFVPEGTAGTFAGISCEWFDSLVDGERRGRICATAPEKLPGGPTLHSMLKSLSAMYEAMEQADLGSIALPIPENPMAPVAKLGLVPIKMEEYRPAESGEAAVATSVELVSVTEQETSLSVLELPAGYTLEDDAGNDAGEP
ncbi:MAG: hypothetical protein KDI17_09975 [Halioglobus sp.]|nr:hypothetical protein [Halioglobus sp.]